MRRILYRVDTAGKEEGLALNAKKTKVLHVSSREGTNEENILIDKIPLENVKDFNYLAE